MTKRIVPYDPNWPRQFAFEAGALETALGRIIVACFHMGSTSVPDMPAKPVIDILLEVGSLPALEEQAELFRASGYDCRGEYGIEGRRYFSRKASASRVACHVHAYETGHFQIRRHLAFRDYLCEMPDVAAAYRLLKAQLSDETGVLSRDYQDTKKAWVDAISLEALRYYDDTRRAGA